MDVHFGIRHLALRVAHVDRAATFYEQGLGMRRFTSQDRGHMAVMTSPGARDILTLSEPEVPTEIEGIPIGRPGEMGGVDHLGFEVQDHLAVKQVADRCIAAGGTFVGAVEMVPGFPSVFLRDRDGYLLQLYGLAPHLRAMFG
ncbi:VOC family protein [Pendulispora albinea]|uniref:VOC family protein n=1 Tax=Pendulispora albinea TaxID=2741071 RepID=A0ABZ2LM53_9BACT